MSGYLEIHCSCGHSFIAYESTPSLEDPGDVHPGRCPECDAAVTPTTECEPVSIAELQPDPYDAANDR